MGAKKFDTSLETREIKLFGRDIPGFCRDIPGAPEKFEKKKFGFNFSSLIFMGVPGRGPGGSHGIILLVGCSSRGSRNNTPFRRVLRRFSNSKCFLEGFLEGAPIRVFSIDRGS